MTSKDRKKELPIVNDEMGQGRCKLLIPFREDDMCTEKLKQKKTEKIQKTKNYGTDKYN